MEHVLARLRRRRRPPVSTVRTPTRHGDGMLAATLLERLAGPAHRRRRRSARRCSHGRQRPLGTGDRRRSRAGPPLGLVERPGRACRCRHHRGARPRRRPRRAGVPGRSGDLGDVGHRPDAGGPRGGACPQRPAGLARAGAPPRPPRRRNDAHLASAGRGRRRRPAARAAGRDRPGRWPARARRRRARRVGVDGRIPSRGAARR